MWVKTKGASAVFPEIGLLTFVLLLLCFNVKESSGAKILSINFFSSKSHKITYEKLIIALAERGHEVTYVGPYLSGKKVENLKEYQALDVQTLEKEMNSMGNPYEIKQIPGFALLSLVINPFLFIANSMERICKLSYELPIIQEIMKEKYDLIFFPPFFNECLYGLVYKMNTTVVLFQQVTTMQWISGNLGTPSPPSFVPSMMQGFTDQMSYTERLISLYSIAYTWVAFNFYYYAKAEGTYREYFNDPTMPSIQEIEKNVSIVLANSHVSITRPRPLMPDIIDVGGLHLSPAKPVPKNLDEFIAGAGTNGFILFSMGSALKGSMMPENYRKMFLNVFSKLPQRVIWKWETEKMDDLPPNVKLSKWLPQPDVLGDKRCRLFITHGGHGSTVETVYHGVPVIGIPMFGDQLANIKKTEALGIGISLEFSQLTEEILLNAMTKILTEPSYTEKAKKLSAVFNDQITNPLDAAVYWIEYVLRHGGATHLRSAARDLNFIQYYSLDVLATFALVAIVSLIVNVMLLRACFNKCFGAKKSATVSKKSLKKMQ